MKNKKSIKNQRIFQQVFSFELKLKVFLQFFPENVLKDTFKTFFGGKAIYHSLNKILSF